jgi:hypothetical protein
MHLRRTAALLATATALLAAGPASASSTTLSIQRYQDPDNPLLLDCLMQAKDTTTPFYPLGAVDVRVYGDDTWYDDFLGGPYRFYSDPYYGINFWMPGGCPALNEDWGTDEIYVTLSGYNRDNKFVSLRSNTVSGSF